jgi:pimeloyl-ACP methyl ester carboxylesterase
VNVATFVLIHGGGGSAWNWHLVVPALRKRGHDPVAVDLPSEEESAGWSEIRRHRHPSHRRPR